MSEILNKYVENGTFSMLAMVLVGFVLLFLLKSPIKAFLSSILGYRNKLDDYAFAVHKNRDLIYHNDLVRLTVGINYKNALLIFGSVLSALITPYLFIASYTVYKVFDIKEKFAKLKDFQIYEGIDTDDELLKLFNNKGARINYIVDEIWLMSFLFVFTGLFFGEFLIAIIGVTLAAAILLTTLLVIYNVAMYRINYKYLNYFRGLRLLSSSSLGNNKSLLFITFFAIYSNYTELAGFSPYLWILFAIKIIISMSIKKLLSREELIAKHHQQIENRNYEDVELIASYPNPKSSIRGYQVSTALQMKLFELEKKASDKPLIHLDNYAFYPQAINRTELRKNPLLHKTIKENIGTYLHALDVRKQVLIFGGMDSGKTELMKYIVQQNHETNFEKYKSIIFNDIKADYKKQFYRGNDKDYILNLFDKDASVFCIFTEMQHNIEAGSNFVNNLYESIAGDVKDYFSGRAKQLTSQYLQESFFETNNNIDAWNLFFEKLDNAEKEVEESDNKTKSSVLQVIAIATEILSIIRYQVVEEKRKIFSIHEFIHATDTQLFLVNMKQFSQKLTPYLNAVWGAITSSIMAKEDTNSHLILHVLDEFLSLNLDKDTRGSMLRETRSKGACNVILSQYMPKNEKIIQDLDSSRYALIAFSVHDDFTIEQIIKKIGEAEILAASSSPDMQPNSKKASAATTDSSGHPLAFPFIIMVELIGALLADILKAFKKDKLSYSQGSSKVLIPQMLQSIPRYSHFTFIPSEEVRVMNDRESKRLFRLMAFGFDDKLTEIALENDYTAKESGVLYLGYTPRATLNYDNPHFEQWDMRGYYQSLSSNDKKEERTFDELTQFNHYMNIKFSDSDEEAKKYIVKNKLSNVDVTTLYGLVEEDPKKVNSIIEKYSEQERYGLCEQFFTIDENDVQARYQFCKEHDLIGGILGIFQFADDFIQSKIDEDK